MCVCAQILGCVVHIAADAPYTQVILENEFSNWLILTLLQMYYESNEKKM